MSSFANYENISSHYDNHRKPAGADLIAGIIKKRKNISEVHLLDIGCGTGNYAEAILEFGVGSISLLDGSEGMLAKAKEKLEKAHLYSAVREIKQACLPVIPFPENSFDAVMINQVLHHLDDNSNGAKFTTMSMTIKEVRRVLKSDGILIITTSTPEQESGHWFTNLMPDVQRRYQGKFASLQTIKDILNDNGLSVENAIAYLGHDMYTGYDDVEGPLHESWRKMDSFWSLATDKELKDCLRLVEQLKERNELKEYYKNHDKSLLYGSFTIIEAQIQMLK